MNKWSKDFWVDLFERMASTALYGLLTMLMADNGGVLAGTAEQWWLVVGLPVVLCLVKGLLANLKDPESGASLVNHPPGPEVQ